MSVQTFSTVPPSFDAGSTIIINTTFSDYPSPTWAATLWLSRGSGIETPTSYAGTTGSNGSFDFTLTATQTALLSPDQYRWIIKVTDGTQVEVPALGQGVTNVLPNFATAQTPTTAQLLLVAINVSIAELLANPLSSTNFNGQSFVYKDLTMLMAKRVQIQAEVLREQQAIDRARGGKAAGRIGIRFDPFATGGFPPYGSPGFFPYVTR